MFTDVQGWETNSDNYPDEINLDDALEVSDDRYVVGEGYSANIFDENQLLVLIEEIRRDTMEQYNWNRETFEVFITM